MRFARAILSLVAVLAALASVVAADPVTTRVQCDLPNQYITKYALLPDGAVTAVCTTFGAAPGDVPITVVYNWTLSSGPSVETAVRTADPTIACPVRPGAAYGFQSLSYTEDLVQAPNYTATNKCMMATAVSVTAVCVRVGAVFALPILPITVTGRVREEIACPSWHLAAARTISRCEPATLSLTCVPLVRLSGQSAPAYASRQYDVTVYSPVDNSTSTANASKKLIDALELTVANLSSYGVTFGRLLDVSSRSEGALVAKLRLTAEVAGPTALRSAVVLQLFTTMAIGTSEAAQARPYPSATTVTVLETATTLAPGPTAEVSPLFWGLSAFVAVVTGATGIAAYWYHLSEARAAEKTLKEEQGATTGPGGTRRPHYPTLEDRRIIVTAAGIAFRDDPIVDAAAGAGARRGSRAGGAAAAPGGGGGDAAADDDLEYGDIPYRDVILEWNITDNILGLAPAPVARGAYDLPDVGAGGAGTQAAAGDQEMQRRRMSTRSNDGLTPPHSGRYAASDGRDDAARAEDDLRAYRRMGFTLPGDDDASQAADNDEDDDSYTMSLGSDDNDDELEATRMLDEQIDGGNSRSNLLEDDDEEPAAFDWEPEPPNQQRPNPRFSTSTPSSKSALGA